LQKIIKLLPVPAAKTNTDICGFVDLAKEFFLNSYQTTPLVLAIITITFSRILLQREGLKLASSAGKEKGERMSQ